MSVSAYPALDLVVVDGVSFPDDVRAARLAASPVAVGERVRAYGYGKGQAKLSKHSGRVLARSSDQRWFMIDAKISQGDSGGPVFDHRGRLCGIVVGGGGPEELREDWQVRVDHGMALPFEIESHGRTPRRVGHHALVLDLSVVLPQLRNRR